MSDGPDYDGPDSGREQDDDSGVDLDASTEGADISFENSLDGMALESEEGPHEGDTSELTGDGYESAISLEIDPSGEGLTIESKGDHDSNIATITEVRPEFMDVLEEERRNSLDREFGQGLDGGGEQNSAEGIFEHNTETKEDDDPGVKENLTSLRRRGQVPNSLMMLKEGFAQIRKEAQSKLEEVKSWAQRQQEESEDLTQQHELQKLKDKAEFGGETLGETYANKATGRKVGEA